jgi:fused signal recognition particle receptor
MIDWFKRPKPEPAAPAAAPAGPAAPKTLGEMIGRRAPPPPDPSWVSKLKGGLAQSTAKLAGGIGDIFTKRKLDDAALEELEEVLLQADLGPAMATRVTQALSKERFGKEITPEEVKEFLADEITRVLVPVASPLPIDPARKPHVVLVVGVNGTGKTTTIGKYARQFHDEGKRVWLAAGDTFRAAAVEQLRIWGERTGAEVVTKEQGADAAALAYEAFERARAAGADILLIDTAGRLQNKTGLMDELKKIVRVLQKLDPQAPHSTLLTLDATTGQNAHSQVDIFKQMVQVTGLVVTKLDGSAKGGVLVSLAERFGLPVHAIGVGEQADDLREFDAASFARSLVGLED